MSAEPCFVEFVVEDRARLFALQAVFRELQRCKRSEDWHSDEEWLAWFDDRARATFWWPTDEEAREWQRRWDAAPVSTRFFDPSLERPWRFGAMIEIIDQSEYDLVDCRPLDRDRARLEFEPDAYPYGGVGSLIALVEAFGFEVVLVDEGGEPPFDPRLRRRR